MEKLQLLICALLRSGESKVDVSNLTLPTAPYFLAQTSYLHARMALFTMVLAI